MVTIYLSRHGKTVGNELGILQGQSPGELTDEGREQAGMLGQKLEGIALDAVLSSDLKRCMETVQIAVGHRQLPYAQTPLLRELDWGSYTGWYIKDIDREHLPADVETTEQIHERAGRLLHYIRTHYDGMRVLVVGHGVINKALQAQIQGLGPAEMHLVEKMDNAELRLLEVE